MSPMRAIDLSLRKSPGLRSFDRIHPVSRRSFLQGTPEMESAIVRGSCSESRDLGLLTCMPANEVVFGFRCTRRTSLLELMTTRLAEGLRANMSLALEVLLVTMVRDEIERRENLRVNMVRAQEIHVITCLPEYCTVCPSHVYSPSHFCFCTVSRINGRRILLHRPGHPSPPSD